MREAAAHKVAQSDFEYSLGEDPWGDLCVQVSLNPKQHCWLVISASH